MDQGVIRDQLTQALGSLINFENFHATKYFEMSTVVWVLVLWKVSLLLPLLLPQSIVKFYYNGLTSPLKPIR
jgi:hypothetical protein